MCFHVPAGRPPDELQNWGCNAYPANIPSILWLCLPLEYTSLHDLLKSDPPKDAANSSLSCLNNHDTYLGTLPSEKLRFSRLCRWFISLRWLILLHRRSARLPWQCVRSRVRLLPIVLLFRGHKWLTLARFHRCLLPGRRIAVRAAVGFREVRGFTLRHGALRVRLGKAVPFCGRVCSVGCGRIGLACPADNTPGDASKTSPYSACGAVRASNDTANRLGQPASTPGDAVGYVALRPTHHTSCGLGHAAYRRFRGPSSCGTILFCAQWYARSPSTWLRRRR